MTDKKNDIRSEDVQEILRTPPSWILKWGTVAIILTVFLIGLTGWLVKYPDVVEGEVTLLSSRPPIPVLATKDGTISKLIVFEKDSVSKGQVLALYETKADYADIKKLEKQIARLEPFDNKALNSFKPDSNLILGEILREYNGFLGAFADLNLVPEVETPPANDEILRQKQEIQKNIADIKKLLKDSESKRRRAEKRFKILHETYTGETEHRLRLVKARKKLDKLTLEVKGLKQELSRTKKRLTEITILDLAVSQGNTTDKLEKIKLARERFEYLKNAVEEWKAKNIIRAPAPGIVAFNKYIADNQHLSEGEEILTIIPYQKEVTWIGQTQIPALASGKIRKGQRVILKFVDYDAYEFGYVNGLVTKISILPNNEGWYFVQIALPDGLKTSFGKTLDYKVNMKGRAEIITRDKRLIERALEKLWGLFL